MITKNQRIRLGLFISASVLLFIIIILVVAANQLFKDKDVYYISYQNISVNGLDRGSSVKYLGIKIGSIENIQIDPNDITRVIITIGVKEGTPIKKDVYADISTIGITGIKLIELRGGTNEAETCEPGFSIQAGTSLTEEITGKAEIIGDKIELLLNNLIKISSGLNKDQISALIEQTSETVTSINSILSANKNGISESLKKVDEIISNLATASLSTKIIVDEIESIVTSDTIRTAIGNIAKVSDQLNKANIYQLIEQLNKAVEQTNNVLIQVDGIVAEKRDNIINSIDQLEETIEALNGAAQRIEEDPSILIGGSNPKNPPDDNLE